MTWCADQQTCCHGPQLPSVRLSDPMWGRKETPFVLPRRQVSDAGPGFVLDQRQRGRFILSFPFSVYLGKTKQNTRTMTEPIQQANGHVVSADGSAPSQTPNGNHANATAVDQGLAEKQKHAPEAGKGFDMAGSNMAALTSPPKFDNVDEERAYLKERLCAALRIFARLGYE